MAYNITETYKKIIQFLESDKSSKEKKWFYTIDQVCMYNNVSRDWFYKKFPVGSYRYNTIVNYLKEKRVEFKTAIQKEWFKSKNPTLQLVLYKLLANSTERMIISDGKQIPDTKNMTYNQKMELLRDILDSTPGLLEDKRIMERDL